MLFGIQSIYILLSLLISITIHEFFHAWMANYLGDPTPKLAGRISLNPLVHLDTTGTIMMVLSSFSGIGFGWGKPVPVNPYNTKRDPRTVMGIIGAMGPLSNLVIAALVAIPLRFGSLPRGVISDFMFVLASVNISLAVFNLLPLPPLDGYSVLMAILNAIRQPWASSLFRSLARLEDKGPMVLLLVFMLDYMLPFSIIGTLMRPLMNLFYGLLFGL